jgi:hypothetical protein
MHRRLIKYYDDRRWAEAFLDGEILFRSLSYFRDHEDASVRGDASEGASIYRPQNGLVVNNLTRGMTSTLPGHRLESATKFEELFVFCASNSHSVDRQKKFSSVARVEILDIKTLCTRVKRALPPEATFRGQRVEYYLETANATPRWALPDKIATSKLIAYAWQDEYRLLFSLTDALEFEKVDLRLVPDGTQGAPLHATHHEYLVKAESLRDICRLHEVG